MKVNTISKSSFTLPRSEIPLVFKLKKTLGLKSNTDVIRTALLELQKKVERNFLREEFKKASLLTRSANAKDREEWDALSAEGLDAD